MGIFGGSRRQVFKPSPYDTRRRPRRLPRWFILLVVGILIGGGGILILQASYGPKRLTINESQKLTDELAAISFERQQLQTRLTSLERQLEAEQSQAAQSLSSLKSEIAELTDRLKPTRDELSLFTQAATVGVKFDPIGIVSARFTQPRGSETLSYHVLLMQANDSTPPYAGRIEVTFEGRYPNGRAGAIKGLVTPIELGHYEHLVGEVPFPDGFVAIRATLRIFQGESTRALSFRTFEVSTPS
jgi:hypothetical protein